VHSDVHCVQEHKILLLRALFHTILRFTLRVEVCGRFMTFIRSQSVTSASRSEFLTLDWDVLYMAKVRRTPDNG
jgi:hypothetical protein